MPVNSKHYRQQLAEYNKKAKEANLGKTGRPYFGKILTVNPKEEDMQIGGATATRASTLHPYIGVNSWMRVCPEPGTGVLMNSREDLANVAILNYDTGVSESRFQGYDKYKNIYRPLSHGEIEVVSTGRSYSWHGNHSYIYGSGMVSCIMDKRDMSYTTRSAVYINNLHDNINDETQFSRFGVITREDKLVKKTDTDSFAKEYALIFDDVKLVIGDVVDAKGQVVKVDDKELIFDLKLKNSTYQLDKEGNATVVLKNKNHTSEDYYEKCKKYRLTCDSAVIKGETTIKGKSLKVESTKTEITSPTTEITSSTIKLGTGTDPMVLGNQLVLALAELGTALSGGSTLGDVKPAIAIWAAKWGVPTASFLSQSQKVSL